MNWLRHARFVATVLLMLQGYGLARAAGPQTVACHCGAHCGCARPDVDDAKLPPCHRHKSPQGPCVRAGCDMPAPALTMVFLLGLPEPEAVPMFRDGLERSWPARNLREAPFLARERPPPRPSA